MKKIVYVAALFAAFAFASCAGNKTSDQNGATADSVAVDEPVGDAAIEDVAGAEKLADTYMAQLDALLKEKHPDVAKLKELTSQIGAAVENLQRSGNAEVVKTYASKVKNYLEENADKLRSIDPQSVKVMDVVNAAVNLPQSVKDAAEAGIDAAKSDGQTVKETMESAGKQAVSDAKAAGKQAVDKAKADAKAAHDAAVKKANEKASEAVQKGADKANEAISNGLKKALGQ